MKTKNYIKFFILLLLFPIHSKAVSISSVSCNPSTVTSGETFTVSITATASEVAYWQQNSNLISSSSNLRKISGDSSVFTETSTPYVTFTSTFKALDVGSATITVNATLSDKNGDNDSSSSNSCTINIVSPNSNSSSSSSSSKKNNNTSNTKSEKSSDTNLKSLSIDEASLNPEFNKDTLEYNVEVENEMDKIIINAEANDSKASVSNTGTKELEEGINKIELVVTAENGATKTYIINVLRKEKNPVIVKIGTKSFTVLRKEGVLNPPEGFEKIDLVINDEEVIAYENKTIGIVLVGLMDENNDVAWYIYANNKYLKYNEFTSNNERLIIISAKKDIPYKYYEYSFDINGVTINGYVLDESSDFRLVYAINLENGEENFYLYDLKENTFQRFYNEQVNIYTSLIKKIKVSFIILGGICLILFISLLIEKSMYKKLKKTILNGVNKEREKIKAQEDKKVEEEKISHTRKINELDLDNEVMNESKNFKKRKKENIKENDKKLDKQKKKEQEKKMREESKKFLS